MARRTSRLPRSPLTWALAAGAVLSVAGAVYALRTDTSSGTTSTTRTATVKKGVVQSTVTGSGNLSPAKQLDLNFGTSGTVTKIYVKEGEHVSQNQLIARIDSSSQRADLAQAEADLESAADALEAAGGSTSTTDASYSSSGTTQTTEAVQTSATTAVLTTAVAASAGAAVATRTAAEDSTTPDTTTATTPTTTDDSSSTSGDTSTSESDTTSESTGQSSSDDSTSSSTATPSASGSSSSGGSAASGGSSSSGGSSDTTSEASAEATYLKAKLAVEEAQEALDNTALRAPVAGTITSLSGAVGDQVSGSGSTSSASSSSSSTSTSSGGSGSSGGSSSSSAFAQLSQLSKLTMSVSFSESDIGKVKVGQAATVTVSALDGVKLAARVTTVGMTGSTSNSVVSYPVTLTLTQTSSGVLAGMSAEAEIVVEQATGVLTVPTQALSGSTLTVVDKDGNATSTRVTTGITGDSTTQIVSGVSAGDTVKLPTLTTSSSSGSSNSSSNGNSSSSGTLGGSSGGGGFGGGGGGGSGGPPSGGGFGG
ncbi:MAG: biotin/lipoyl-binding protein, partial [Patulibacter sp.]